MPNKTDAQAMREILDRLKNALGSDWHIKLANEFRNNPLPAAKPPRRKKK